MEFVYPSSYLAIPVLKRSPCEAIHNTVWENGHEKRSSHHYDARTDGETDTRTNRETDGRKDRRTGKQSIPFIYI